MSLYQNMPSWLRPHMERWRHKDWDESRLERGSKAQIMKSRVYKWPSKNELRTGDLWTDITDGHTYIPARIPSRAWIACETTNNKETGVSNLLGSQYEIRSYKVICARIPQSGGRKPSEPTICLELQEIYWQGNINEPDMLVDRETLDSPAFEEWKRLTTSQFRSKETDQVYADALCKTRNKFVENMNDTQFIWTVEQKKLLADIDWSTGLPKASQHSATAPPTAQKQLQSSSAEVASSSTSTTIFSQQPPEPPLPLKDIVSHTVSTEVEQLCEGIDFDVWSSDPKSTKSQLALLRLEKELNRTQSSSASSIQVFDVDSVHSPPLGRDISPDDDIFIMPRLIKRKRSNNSADLGNGKGKKRIPATYADSHLRQVEDVAARHEHTDFDAAALNHFGPSQLPEQAESSTRARERASASQLRNGNLADATDSSVIVEPVVEIGMEGSPLAIVNRASAGSDQTFSMNVQRLPTPISREPSPQPMPLDAQEDRAQINPSIDPRLDPRGDDNGDTSIESLEDTSHNKSGMDIRHRLSKSKSKPLKELHSLRSRRKRDSLISLHEMERIKAEVQEKRRTSR